MTCAGFHLPSELSDFGKGHTLDLAYIMEERRRELAYQHNEQQAALAAAAAAAPGQVSIQPVIVPGKLLLHVQSLHCCLTVTEVVLSIVLLVRLCTTWRLQETALQLCRSCISHCWPC